MSIKRVIIAVVAAFVFSLVWNAVVHGIILDDANAQLESLRRAHPDLVLGLLVTLVLDLLFVMSFAVRPDGADVRTGLRQGLFFGLLAGVLVDANQYLLYPLPLSLVMSWFAFGLVEFTVLGALVGWLNPFGHRNEQNNV